MSVKVIGKTFNQYAESLKKPPMDKMLSTAKDDLVKLSPGKRFKNGIETVKESDTKGRIFINDEIVPAAMQKSGVGIAMNQNTATNKQIGGFFHYGTPDHGPVRAKFLSFIVNGKRIFAKKVRGIKATNWWV